VPRQDCTISSPPYCARMHASLPAVQHGWWRTHSENGEKQRKGKVTHFFANPLI
jgi:hypothetical protein